MSKRLITFVCILVMAGTANAQTTLDTAKTVAAQFYSRYDTVRNLTFDIKFVYTSDTVYSDFSHEVVTGTYTLSGKRARYRIGNAEFLQNDSFFIAVYHDDQAIVISAPKVQNAGMFMPVRAVSDSLMLAEASHYDFAVKTTTTDYDTDNTGFIRITRKTTDTTGQFLKYTIYYTLSSMLVSAVEYEFVEPGQGLTSLEEPDPGALLLKNTARNRKLRIEFSNYRFEHVDDEDYSESVYVWEEDGQIRPVAKFKTYTIYNARN